MKYNKDNPYKTKEEAIIIATKWYNEHIHEYPKGLTPHYYSIFPFTPDGVKVLTFECNWTHRTVKRFYYKESVE